MLTLLKCKATVGTPLIHYMLEMMILDNKKAMQAFYCGFQATALVVFSSDMQGRS